MGGYMIYGREFCPTLPQGCGEIPLTLYGSVTETMILVLPGGGYGVMAAAREGHPVAHAFEKAGFGAAVLQYSLCPRPWYLALLETMGAIAYLKGQGAKRVVVCGFSAGGHLAACSCNFWRDTSLYSRLGLTYQQVRPDGVILGYPVITGEGPHKNIMTFNNLLGEGSSVPANLSLHNDVQGDNPPAFLWATVADDTVPVEHTLLYANALRKAQVPFELHLYPHGPHAMALATEKTKGYPQQQDPHVATWFSLAVEWLGQL